MDGFKWFDIVYRAAFLVFLFFGMWFMWAFKEPTVTHVSMCDVVTACYFHKGEVVVDGNKTTCVMAKR